MSDGLDLAERLADAVDPWVVHDGSIEYHDVSLADRTEAAAAMAFLVARVRALTEAGNALAERTAGFVDWFEASGYPRAADDPNVAALAAWRALVGEP